MWTYILVSILHIGYNSATIEQPKEPVGELQIGLSFKDLSSSLQEDLNNSKHWDADNRFSTLSDDAPNTDKCWSFNTDCQPDRTHHLFQVPMPEHKGYFYTVVFSNNWRILDIKDGFSHQ